jgi:hypothetical protein
VGVALEGKSVDVHGTETLIDQAPVDLPGKGFGRRAEGRRHGVAGQVGQLADPEGIAPQDHHVIAHHQVGQRVDAFRRRVFER